MKLKLAPLRVPDLLNQRSNWIFSRSPVEQISPNKGINFPCTKLPRPAHAPHQHPCRRPPHLPYLSNQRALCCLAHSPTRLGLVCDFCSSARTFAVRLPPHRPSRGCTCFKLVVIIGGLPLSADFVGNPRTGWLQIRCWFTHRGLSPH